MPRRTASRHRWRRRGQRRQAQRARHRKGGADARDQERAGNRRHGQDCQRQPDQEPDLGLRHVQFIMQLRNDWRHDQKRHAHGDASKPEETKQSSKTAGRATVAARRCWHEDYPARGVTGASAPPPKQATGAPSVSRRRVPACMRWKRSSDSVACDSGQREPSDVCGHQRGDCKRGCRSSSFHAQPAHFCFSADSGHIDASHRSATPADARRGAAHGGELRQVAGAAAWAAADKRRRAIRLRSACRPHGAEEAKRPQISGVYHWAGAARLRRVWREPGAHIGRR